MKKYSSHKKELLEQYKGLMQQLFSQVNCGSKRNGNDYADWRRELVIGLQISGGTNSEIQNKQKLKNLNIPYIPEILKNKGD
jgi:hypothetical protein